MWPVTKLLVLSCVRCFEFDVWRKEKGIMCLEKPARKYPPYQPTKPIPQQILPERPRGVREIQGNAHSQFRLQSSRSSWKFNMQYILNVIHQASCGTYVRGIMFADEGLAQLMKAQRFEAMFAISKNELRLQCP